MASPPATFTLDRSVFNESLYSHVRDFWLGPIPPGAAKATPECDRIWYGRDISQEEKAVQDRKCWREFGHALEAVAPGKLALPAFESYEKDVEEASSLSKPFLDEVKQAQGEDEQKASETLLSLLILFDQISRNVYRDPPGLRLVFQHYDRLAHALVHSSMHLKPSPMLHPSHRLRPVVRQWFLMPLMHSEHIPSHNLFCQVFNQAREDGKNEGVEDAVTQVEHSLAFEKLHMEPLEKFGRYPHRNEALGRENSEEEEEFLKKGETFGVAQQHKDEVKGEGREKSEL